MKTYTGTNTIGSPIIAVHATGCAHALDPDCVVGTGDTIEETVTSAMNLVDPDNDYMGAWKTRVVACTRKVSS